MRAYKDFIISPIGERYNNSKKVIATPLLFQSPINVGDEIIVHHNVFRRWHDVKGREKNSRSYLNDNKYLITGDQLFLYKSKYDWKAMSGYSFIKPLRSIEKFDIETEKPLVGVVKYTDGTFKKEELVGFRPGSEYEFIIDGERLYRVMNQFINIKYEYKGNEEEYNPSWT